MKTIFLGAGGSGCIGGGAGGYREIRVREPEAGAEGDRFFAVYVKSLGA